MATKIELVNRALAEIKLATWAPQKWVYAIGHGLNGKPYNFEGTHNFKAQKLLWDALRAPGASPPPSAFASPSLQEAYIRMSAAYFEPLRWAHTVRDGHKGAPYQYTLTRNWQAQVALWAARSAKPHDPPPPPPVDPTVPPNPRLQNVSVGAWGPWDALRWPKCKIWLSADPAESLSKFVNRADADSARHDGHDVGVWYVPDQVSVDRARQVADILGTDLIAADCETLYRWKLAYHAGIRNGIYNLTELWEDKEANDAISSGEFHGMNEFYWNQSKHRQPDNHHLPTDAMCVAVYDGHSDSTEGDAWEPHISEYHAAGYLWPTVCVYQQNMTGSDWDALPRIP